MLILERRESVYKCVGRRREHAGIGRMSIVGQKLNF
jgi:hypothetical protein